MTEPKNKDAALLARKKAAGLAPGAMTAEEAASFAARQLALLRFKKAKPGEYAAMGRKGAKALWAKYADPRERHIEMMRRQAARRANRRKRIRAAIEGQK